MGPKVADVMANSVNTVCPDLSVWKLRIIMHQSFVTMAPQLRQGNPKCTLLSLNTEESIYYLRTVKLILFLLFSQELVVPRTQTLGQFQSSESLFKCHGIKDFNGICKRNVNIRLQNNWEPPWNNLRGSSLVLDKQWPYAPNRVGSNRELSRGSIWQSKMTICFFNRFRSVLVDSRSSLRLPPIRCETSLQLLSVWEVLLQVQCSWC